MEGERMIASCQLRWQQEREQLVCLVDVNRRFRERVAIQRCFRDLQLERIQDQLVNRTSNTQLNRFRPGKDKLLDVRHNPNRVIQRDDLFRQFSGRVLKTEWLLRIYDDRKRNGEQRC